MRSKKKVWLSISLFLLVFISLLLVATFKDFQISQLLTKNSLPANEYFSTNSFALFFEVVGSSPIYFLIGFGLMVIGFNLKRLSGIKGKLLFYLFLLLAVIPNYLMIYDIFNYVGEHMRNEEYMSKSYLTVIQISLAVLIEVLLVIILFKTKEETLKKLLTFSYIALSSCAVYILVTVIKTPMGRVRYRTMNALNDFDLYTKWFVANGKQSFEGLPSDNCKSFPSGHTFAAGMIYMLIVLPDLFDRFKTKKWQISLYSIAILFTGLVALSRIIAGAHFLSDVLVGGSMAFVSVMLFREVFIYKFSFLKRVSCTNSAADVEISQDNS